MTGSDFLCPVCSQTLQADRKTWVCPNGHSFDIAKQGYVNLSRKQKATGDNAEMVKARTAFLEQGHYAFLRQAVCDRIPTDAVLLDVGCGQGYYTGAFPAKKKYGIDLSKAAIAHAAATDKSTAYAVAGMHRLPFANGTMDVVTSIFTPLAPQEIRRVLKPGGILIQVQPAPDHLHELKQVLYPEVKPNPEPDCSLPGFVLEDRQTIHSRQQVHDVWDLLEMTPYRYRASRQGLEAVQHTDMLEVTFGFVISVWKRSDSCGQEQKDRQ